MKKKRKVITDAVEILRRMDGHGPEDDKLIAQFELEFRISMVIYDARKRAGLTQKGLADLVGTTQSVISRLEDADYEGHSLSMLQRIAAALGQRVEVRFVPDVA